MDKRDEINDPASCLNRALDDEPVFVLLARDEAATVAVWAWIRERIVRGKNRSDDPQVRDAAAWCHRARDWKQKKGKA